MILGKLKNFIPIGPKNPGMIGYNMEGCSVIRGDIQGLSCPEGKADIEYLGQGEIHRQYNELQGIKLPKFETQSASEVIDELFESLEYEKI